MRMKALVRLAIFLFQAVVVGLAAAFVVVWMKPGLLATRGAVGDAPGSYASAVAASSPAVVNVHSARHVRQTAGTGTKSTPRSGLPDPYTPPAAQLENSLGS